MSAARLDAAEEALRKAQAQAAALEELSEQLSLAVHVLEAEIAQLRRSSARAGGDETRAGGKEAGGGVAAPARSSDMEGARLVALNMALEGKPREETDHYLAEHFDIPDRERLLDEVYEAAGR